MLKYIIAFTIISFYKSTESIIGDYDVLIFSQSSPVSAYKVLQNKLRSQNWSEDNIKEYMKEHANVLTSLPPKSWIISKLRSIKLPSEWIVDCQDVSGKHLQHNHPIPSKEVKKEMKSYWPSTIPNMKDRDVWKAEYNRFGTCINATASEYLQYARNLQRTYSIGGILARSDIYPGSKPTLRRIIDAIKREAKALPYVKCFYSKEQEQHLLEIEICFNRESVPLNCSYFTAGHCKPDSSIFYPN